MFELLLACGNELVEARAAAPPAWWMVSRETTLALVLGLGGPAAAATGVLIYRWALELTGVRRALVVGAGVGFAIALAWLFVSRRPPLALVLAVPVAPLLLVLLRALTARVGRRRDARVEVYPCAQAAGAWSG